MPITRGNDASIFAAGEFSADEKLVRFLDCQPAPLSGHELRIACTMKKENAKHLFVDETER
jgi:roadblock/LC7 domain-containing protein